MKKICSLFLTAICCLTCGIVLSACKTATPEKIEIIDNGIDFVYFQGDNFDEVYNYQNKSHTNIPDFKITYTDGKTKTVTYGNENLVFSGYSRNVYNETTKSFPQQTITVTYTENNVSVTTTYNVSMTNSRGPKILKQPQSAVVNYPNGVTYTIDVESAEENEVSYQWQIYIKGGFGGTTEGDGGFGSLSNDEIDLNSYVEFWQNIEGKNGTKSTLDVLSILPEGSNNSNVTTKFRCLVTDKYGITIASNVVSYSINNVNEFVPCIYIGDYAIQAGETLDLSTTNLRNNSGKISLDANGYDITFDNVNFSNEERYVSFYSNPVGFELRSYNNEFANYNIHLKGNNTFKNIVYQPSYNSAGIPICFNFLSESKIPTVTFIGEEEDSKLNLIGGTELIYTNSPLVIDKCKIYLENSNFGSGYDQVNVIGNGIKSKNLVVTNSAIEANVNGAVIILCDYSYEPGNIDIIDSSISGTSTISRVGVGGTLYNCIKACGDITFNNATINLEIKGDSFRLNPGTNQFCEMATIIRADNFDVYNSNTIKLKISADECYPIDEYERYNYIQEVTAVTVLNKFNIIKSNFEIEADAQAIINLAGVDATKLDVEKSNLNISLKARGMVQGLIVADAKFVDSSVCIETDAYEDYEDVSGYYAIQPKSLPVICSTLCVEFIEVKNKNVTFTNFIENGLALIAEVAYVQEQVNYVNDYTPQNIILGTNVKILKEGSTINQFTSATSSSKYLKCETIFDTIDETYTKASTVTIVFFDDDNPPSPQQNPPTPAP